MTTQPHKQIQPPQPQLALPAPPPITQYFGDYARALIPQEFTPMRPDSRFQEPNMSFDDGIDLNDTFYKALPEDKKEEYQIARLEDIAKNIDETAEKTVEDIEKTDFNTKLDAPTKQHKSVYLAKITDRKRQWLYQNINDIDFVGNKDDNRFNFNRSNYLGEWDKDTLYHNLTDYANLVLLSDGEADPLVTKEALIAGLGVVVSECSTANLDLSKPFINVIPEDKIYDLNFVRGVIETNKQESLKRRNEIREYGIQNFAWENVVQKYMNVVNQIISK